MRCRLATTVFRTTEGPLTALLLFATGLPLYYRFTTGEAPSERACTRSIRAQVGLQIYAGWFGFDHHKGRNEIVGKDIAEDSLSRLDWEHVGLDKSMPPTKFCTGSPVATDTDSGSGVTGQASAASSPPSPVPSRKPSPQASCYYVCVLILYILVDLCPHAICCPQAWPST